VAGVTSHLAMSEKGTDPVAYRPSKISSQRARCRYRRHGDRFVRIAVSSVFVGPVADLGSLLLQLAAVSPHGATREDRMFATRALSRAAAKPGRRVRRQRHPRGRRCRQKGGVT